MAVAPVKKVLIAVHKSEEKSFLDLLQELGAMHITTIEVSQESVAKTTTKETLEDITSAIDYLTTFNKKPGFMAGLASEKTLVDKTEFESLTKKYDWSSTVDKIKVIHQKISALSNQQKTLESDITQLTPWQKLNHNLSDIYNSQKTEIILGIFTSADALKQTQICLVKSK
jgi:vacuolar-type H+-ATPase subunit I/STV1